MNTHRRNLELELESLEQENNRLREQLNARSIWMIIYTLWRNSFQKVKEIIKPWSSWKTEYFFEGRMQHIRRTRSKNEQIQTSHFVSDGGYVWHYADTGERTGIFQEGKLDDEWDAHEIRLRLNRS
jgi:hypothetical protein